MKKKEIDVKDVFYSAEYERKAEKTAGRGHVRTFTAPLTEYSEFVGIQKEIATQLERF